MIGMDGTPGMVAAEMARNHWNEFPLYFHDELKHTIALYRTQGSMPEWEWLPDSS